MASSDVLKKKATQKFCGKDTKNDKGMVVRMRQLLEEVWKKCQNKQRHRL